MAYIREGLKHISRNCGETFCRKLGSYMEYWYIGIPGCVIKESENKLEGLSQYRRYGMLCNIRVRKEDVW